MYVGGLGAFTAPPPPTLKELYTSDTTLSQMIDWTPLSTDLRGKIWFDPPPPENSERKFRSLFGRSRTAMQLWVFDWLSLVQSNQSQSVSPYNASKFPGILSEEVRRAASKDAAYCPAGLKGRRLLLGRPQRSPPTTRPAFEVAALSLEHERNCFLFAFWKVPFTSDMIKRHFT